MKYPTWLDNQPFQKCITSHNILLLLFNLISSFQATWNYLIRSFWSDYNMKMYKLAENSRRMRWNIPKISLDRRKRYKNTFLNLAAMIKHFLITLASSALVESHFSKIKFIKFLMRYKSSMVNDNIKNSF